MSAHSTNKCDAHMTILSSRVLDSPRDVTNMAYYVLDDAWRALAEHSVNCIVSVGCSLYIHGVKQLSHVCVSLRKKCPPPDEASTERMSQNSNSC